MRAPALDRSRLKLALAAVLFLLLTAAVGFVVAAGGKAIFLVERGGTADPIENSIVDLAAQEPGRVTWLPDAATVERQVDDGTRRRIADAYLRGWRQIEQALATCSTSGLGMYFGPGPAAQLETLVAESRADGCLVRRNDGAHELRLTFVSEDGGLVALTDERHWYVDRLAAVGAGTTYVETTSSRDLVMRLDDGEWRVAAWDQRSPVDAGVGQVGRVSGSAAFGLGMARGDDGNLSVERSVDEPVGVNYYPASTPWRAFWADYDPAVIDADLSLAAALEFDAVRIFLPFGDGAERPSDERLDQLEDFLGRATERDIRVVVTLFDLDFDYRPSAWVAADRYLERLLTRFADEPAVLAWDLKNEPDLDDDRFGRPLVDAWLRHVIATARRLDPSQPLTVGWSETRWAGRLAESLDIVSVHDYRDPATLADRLQAAAMAAADRPLWLSEYGAASWQSPLAPSGGGEAGQAAHIAAVHEAISSLPPGTVAGRFVWSLRDHDLTAASPDGTRPWRRGAQRSFGLIRTDDTLKPAASVLGGDPVTEPPLYGPYAVTLALAAAWGLALAIVAWRRRRLSASGAVLLALAHPLAYVAIGLALTVIAELLRIDDGMLPALAGMALVGASLAAWLSVAAGAWAWRRLNACCAAIDMPWVRGGDADTTLEVDPAIPLTKDS